jgi:cytochrome c oxidase cbb3-type subunit 3/ubiquinol-cytochrome c reductase cytochrome c subunit
VNFLEPLRRWAGSVAVAVLSAACGDGAADVDHSQGQALYGKYCALCHGNQGQGYQADAANALTNQAFLSTVTDEFLFEGIARGRPGTPMSSWGKAFGGPLSDGEVNAIVGWLRSSQRVADRTFSSAPITTGSVERGKIVYTSECRGCHGQDGKGGPYMSIVHPVFLKGVSDAWLRHVIADGRAGTPMPGFGGILEPYHIDDLVALMRSWQQPVGDHLVVEPPKTLPPAVQNPGGPAPAFAAQSGRYVSASDLKTAMDAKAELVVVDARPAGDYPAFHLPGAVSLPFYAADQLGPQLPKTVWTVTYCACPHAESTALAEALEQQGHQHVRVLDEGILYWKKLGWPLATGPLP